MKEVEPSKRSTVEIAIGIHADDDGERSVSFKIIEDAMVRTGVFMTPNRARLYGEMLIRCAEALEDGEEWESEDE